MLCAALMVGPTSSKSVWSKALKYPELASIVGKHCNVVRVEPSNYVQLYTYNDAIMDSIVQI